MTIVYRHASMMTTVASHKTHLDAIVISFCQGDDTRFDAFQTPREWEFFVSVETGNSLFSKRSLQPLYFSRSPPSTQSSLPFCDGVLFSRDSLRAFNDRIKIHKQLARKYARIFVRGHCSEKRTAFWERSSRKTASYEEQIMSKDK